MAGSRAAIFALVFCCVLWGLSFPVMQIAAHALDRAVGRAGVDPSGIHALAARATFNGWRFGLAAVIYAAVTLPRQRRFTAADWAGGLLVGLFFGVGIFLQIVGLRFALPSISGFLTALAVIFAPIAQAVVFRNRVGGRTWLAVGVAIVGGLLLTRANPDAAGHGTLIQTPPVKYLGEMLTLTASLVFTAQIMAIDHFGRRGADPVRLTLIMLAVTAVVNAAGGAALGGARIYRAEIVTVLLKDQKFVASVAALVVLSSVMALHLMNTYQPLVSPATASVVYCAEPVFATAFSVMFATEKLTGVTVLGGVVVLLAVLIVARREAPPQHGFDVIPRK